MVRVPPPDNMPSLPEVILPSRAFLLSWRDQTIPARLAALDDAFEHFDQVAEEDVGLRDMALLALIGQAVQPLEDLAHLAYAWDRPYVGVATYVRATAWWRHTASNFWQTVAKWDDGRLDVFAGLAGRDHEKDEIVPLLKGMELDERATDEQRVALVAAAEATRVRLRRDLAGLAADWQQFSAYFLAHKHGGLALNRDDFAFVDDEVEEVTEDTTRREVSIAVWLRRRDGIHGDEKMTPTEVARYTAGTGRLAIDLLRSFVRSRFAIFEALEISPEGQLLGLREMQLPWTVWLHPEDMDEEHWRAIGFGPRLTPTGDGGTSSA